MFLYTKLIYFIILLVISLPNAFAQEKNSMIFDYKHLYDIRLIADFGAIFNDISDTADYHDARLITRIGKEKFKFDIELKTRGNFRRNQDNCNFPPLRINFKKKNIKGTPFEHCDKIKLVTHCNTDDNFGNTNVLTEYLIYKMFNLLTDTSFKVSLAKIKYISRPQVYPPTKRFGFFIEKTNHVEKRIGLKEYEPKYINHSQINKKFFTLVSLFSYLIGNTDYSVLIPQNIKLLANNKNGPFIILPYDFDLSRMVDPSYAPYNQMGNDRQEVPPTIKAYCQDYEDFTSAITRFNTLKQDLINLVADFNQLDEERCRKLLNRIDEFYRTINNRDLFIKVLDNYCRNE